ncbi:MAG: hypothetical protein ABIO67_02555 [Mycobacteriales bacterium]
MTPTETAARLKKPIGDLGMQFMADPLTREAGKQLGLRSRPLYHLGRGGALGEVSVEVVIAAFAFFPPQVVTEHWNAAREVMDGPECARAYAGMCNDWGRRAFTGQPGIGRADELLGTVIAAAQSAGLPLFAGWRQVVLPADVPGRLAQRLHVMREHRGAVHVAAVAAVGLDPLAAVVAGTYGVANATFFEWPEPYPDPDLHREAWAAAETLTAAAASSPYDVLTDAECDELVALLEGLHATVLG